MVMCCRENIRHQLFERSNVILSGSITCGTEAEKSFGEREQ